MQVGKLTFWSGVALRCCSTPPCFCYMCGCLLLPIAAWGVKTTKHFVCPPPPQLLSAELTASSIYRHPSYFKHSALLMWKHVRNLDDWPSTPPPSTPTIPALCYLLRGRRGQWRPGCLDDVITVYQWQRGGKPADLRGRGGVGGCLLS